MNRDNNVVMDDYEKANNFDNVCADNRISTPVSLHDVLTITTNSGEKTIYDGNGNRLTYDDVDEYIQEIISRA